MEEMGLARERENEEDGLISNFISIFKKKINWRIILINLKENLLLDLFLPSDEVANERVV